MAQTATGGEVVSDDQVRMTLIDDGVGEKPTWSHWFVPKHLTVEQEEVTVARSRGGRLWPADLEDSSPSHVEGMAAVVTWQGETYTGRISSANASVAVMVRDR